MGKKETNERQLSGRAGPGARCVCVIIEQQMVVNALEMRDSHTLIHCPLSRSGACQLALANKTTILITSVLQTLSLN